MINNIQFLGRGTVLNGRGLADRHRRVRGVTVNLKIIFCFLSHQMSPLALGEQQEFSTHLSLFFSPRSHLLMTRGKPTTARLFLFPERGRQQAFQQTRFSQPSPHPKGKEHADCPHGDGNSPDLTPPHPQSVQSKTA